MNANRPLFRADHVGSLLRPDLVKQARTRHLKINPCLLRRWRKLRMRQLLN